MPPFRKHFSNRFFIRRDELDDEFIPATYGQVYAYSDDVLGVQVFYHRKIANRVAALGLELAQDGDDEKTFLLSLDDPRLDQVLALIRCRRRPQLSPERREQLRLHALKHLQAPSGKAVPSSPSPPDDLG